MTLARRIPQLKGAGLEQARLLRTVRFGARHHYHNPRWTAEQNAEVFGLQGSPHEHDWRVEVHVVGPVNVDTGWCCDVGALDAALARLLHGWDRGDLNALVPEVASGAMRPSTENLARWIYEHLDGELAGPARLLRVEVHESDELGSAYPGSPP